MVIIGNRTEREHSELKVKELNLGRIGIKSYRK